MVTQSKILLSFLAGSLPLRIEDYQREAGSEHDQDPLGPSEVQKPLHVSYFLFVEKGFRLLGLPSIPENRFKKLC